MLFGLNNFKLIGDNNSLIMFNDQAGVGLRCKNVILESVSIGCTGMYSPTETSIRLLSCESEQITQLPNSDDEKSIVELLKLIKHKLDGRE